MKKNYLFEITALVVIIGLLFTGCGNKDDGVVTKTLRYIGVNSSNIDVYELVITSNSDSPQTGDAYVLTFYANGGGNTAGKLSSGTITVNGNTFTLSNGTGLTATVSGGSLTGMSGTISFDKGGTQAAPSSLTPVKDGGDGSLNGTWKKGYETVKVNGSSFSYTDGYDTYPGTGTYGDGILVTYGTYRGDTWLVAGNYTVNATQLTFSGFPGFSFQFSGTWLKQ